MKFSKDFQPRRVLGFTGIFLLFFCPFCAWGDVEYNYDSDENPFEFYSETEFTTTTSRPTGTGTGTGTRKTVPDPHKIGIVGTYSFDQKIECRGADVSNLTVIKCEDSIIMCRKKLSCLLNATSCKNHDDISKGEYCPSSQSSYYSRVHGGSVSGTRSEKCLKVPVSWQIRAGILKCVSSLPLHSSPFSTNQKITTTEYFYTGADSKVHLLSSHKPANKTMLKLGISYSGNEDYSWREEERTEPPKVYTNEPLVITCTAANFLIDTKSLKIEARTENGTEHQIDPTMYSESSATYAYATTWTRIIRRFRVPKDIHSFSCAGRRLDNLEIIRTTTNIIVTDPPSQLFVKLPNGSEIQVDSPVGCNLAPRTATEFRTLRSRIFNLLDIFRHSEFWITSPISFLRFQNITKGNFSCSPLQSDGNPISNTNSKANSKSSSNDDFDYYFDPEVKKPRIEKPASGASTVVLNGHGHRSLKCKYTGNPMPYVIWLQNGKEIFYTVGKESSTDEPGFETAVLHLPLQNLDNSTEISSVLDSNVNVVYSCVVQNYLGVDQLDFKIENDKNSAPGAQTQPNQKSNSEEKSGGLIYVLISCIFLVTLVGLSFYFLRGKLHAQRAVVAQFRADERNNHWDVDSRNFGNPGQNPSHSHTEISSNGGSHGISVPNQFRSGEAIYKSLI